MTNEDRPYLPEGESMTLLVQRVNGEIVVAGAGRVYLAWLMAGFAEARRDEHDDGTGDERELSEILTAISAAFDGHPDVPQLTAGDQL